MQLEALSPPPFRPSRLRYTIIPPCPLSPTRQTVFLPTPTPATPLPAAPRIYTTPPTSQPVHWTWQCHVCRRGYAFSATRRCLDDGHYFCAGGANSSSAMRRYDAKAATAAHGRGGARRSKKSQACASEFDYTAWEAYGEWRRGEHRARRLLLASSARDADESDGFDSESDCSRECNYPSECRWSGVLARRKVAESRETAATHESAGSGWTVGTSTFKVLGLEFEIECVDIGAGYDAGAGACYGKKRDGPGGNRLRSIVEESEDGV